jgi:hypothetical protein
MEKATVTFPETMDLEHVLRFSCELDRYAQCKSLTIVCGQDRWFPAFCMLYLGSKLKSMRDANPELDFKVMHNGDLGYLEHMGFFRLFGVPFGRELGEAYGSTKYLPITCVKREDLYSDPSSTFSELGDLIQKHADKISEMVSRDFARSEDVFNVLSYSLREIIRNVFEHGQTDMLYYCGQYWPNSNRVEVSIADLGVGVRRALSENPNFRYNTDKQAIEMSLMPGVSGKTHLGRREGNWTNSGYGLYMTNRLARNGGNFVIVSGRNAIQLSPNSKKNLQSSFPGTALRVNLNTEKIGDVKARLNEFRKDAQKISAAMANPSPRPPSGISLLLRRDFSS